MEKEESCGKGIVTIEENGGKGRERERGLLTFSDGPLDVFIGSHDFALILFYHVLSP